jgi:hypothetical protein
MKSSDLLVNCLENENVKYVFGIMGKETLDLVHSLTDSSIEFIVVRHEQSAAYKKELAMLLLFNITISNEINKTIRVWRKGQQKDIYD